MRVEQHHHGDDKQGNFVFGVGALLQHVAEAELFSHDYLDRLTHVLPRLRLQDSLGAFERIPTLGVQMLVPLIHTSEGRSGVKEGELFRRAHFGGGDRATLLRGLLDNLAASARLLLLLFFTEPRDFAVTRFGALALPAGTSLHSHVVDRVLRLRRVTMFLCLLLHFFWVLSVGDVIVRHIVAGVLIVARAKRVVSPEGRVGILEHTLRLRADTHIIYVTRILRNYRVVLKCELKWRHCGELVAFFSDRFEALVINRRLVGVQNFHIDLGRGRLASQNFHILPLLQVIERLQGFAAVG